jgi:DNA-binding XRE family transcriptional regulator
MGDLKNYIRKRMENDSGYADTYASGYECFRTGLILKTLRRQGGMTQEELAGKLNMSPGAVSRMENHAGDMRLSDLMRAARLFDRKLLISIE